MTERYAIEPKADTRTGTERRHATWRVTAAEPPGPESDPESDPEPDPESRRRRAETAAAVALAQAVHDARVSAGLSEADLATRAGLHEDAIVRVEESGTVPTPALLNRLARALDGDVALTWTGNGVTATFTPHPT
ncbi:helix-turn-helix domain-containing protein [Streptomycetaceae bacterium NBC_01309]